MQQVTRNLLLILITILNLLFSQFIFAESQDIFFSDIDSSVASKIIEQADASIEKSQKKSRLLTTEKRLLDLKEALHKQDQQLSELYQQIDLEIDEQDNELLLRQLSNAKERYIDLRKSFDEQAAGGISLQQMHKKDKSDISEIDSGINDILRPFVISLKRMTDVPRKVELYKADLASMEQQLSHIESALLTLSGIIELTENIELKSSLLSLEKKWLLEKVNTQHHTEVTKAQLNDLLEQDKFELSALSAAAVTFLSGTGLNLLLAILAFIITLTTLTLIRWIWLIRPGRRTSSTHLYSRALQLIFRWFSIVLALIVTIFTLYARRDWLLLGFLGIIILGIIWSLKNTLPKFVNELRLIMNMGVVRERERVHYKGIPWIVESIGLFSQLSNPALTAGQIRIRLDELNSMHARAYVSNEPWFPTNEGDYVLLSDSQYGQIELQTPETVYVRTIGSSTRSYPTADFIRMSPLNLSKRGFGLFLTFKLNYKHHNQITSIIENLEASMSSIIKNEPVGQNLISLVINFKQSTLEALELKCIAIFNGDAACDYYTAQSILHRSALDTCNEFGWELAQQSIEVKASIIE